MNIELRFLQKAVQDKNYISFSYQNKKLKKMKPLKLIQKEDQYYLHTLNEVYEFEEISNIKILKEKF